MSFIRDLLRYGLPTIGAAGGAAIAASRSRKIGWALGGAAAGWGAGWLAQYIIDRAASPRPEQLPTTAAMGFDGRQLPMDVPTVDQIMAETGPPDHASDHQPEPAEKPEKAQVSGTVVQLAPLQAQQKGFDAAGQDPFGDNQGSE